MALSRLPALLAGVLMLSAGPVLAEEGAPPTTPQAPVEAGIEVLPAPEPALEPINAAIRDMLTAEKKPAFLSARDLSGLTAFYEVRGYFPAWVAEGRLTERAKALVRRISEADSDGLDASAYVLPPVMIGEDGKATPLSLAQVELLTSQAILSYAADAEAGRVDPAKLSRDFGYKRHLPDPIQVLTAVQLASDAPAQLAEYNPPHPEFAALRDKLAELRASQAKAAAPVPVPEGPSLKPGMIDPRVVILRSRLELPVPSEAPDVYDDAVVEAVRDFQKSAGLKPDGIVGPASLAALNRGPVDPIPLILANMERWRWMPRDLGHMQVRVNIPDYSLAVIRDGEVIHTTRVVVGTVKNQTPIFSDEIKHIVVNPSWNVPVSIAKNELLPAARANPGSLRGYEVQAKIGGRFRVVDPWSINWHQVSANQVRIRQPPSERNALGSVKFLFPNQYSVYLHDTPSKSLFQRDQRAYSHGCVRVMEPMEFADALLREEPKLNAAQLKKRIGGKEQWFNLATPVPVHLTYFTAWVDESGVLQTRRDIYGHDTGLEEALGIPQKAL